MINMTIFAELGLNSRIQENVSRLGYETPTDIQQQSIGAVLSGADTYAIAPTGTGKTAAYLLPVLQELSQKDYSDEQIRPIRALILVPTRELAQQLEVSIAEYGKGLKLRTISIFGGTRVESQIKRFKRGADILVATPKRLIDLIKAKAFTLKHIKHFIMDEADRLVSMGINKELSEIQKNLPNKKQMILFSATDSKALTKFSDNHLTECKMVKTEQNQPALEKIVHTMYRSFKDEKTKNLFRLLDILNCDRALIFTRTKHDVNRITQVLNEKGFTSEGIHNEIPQKKRDARLQGFKNSEFKFLVATDIASRGIDINELYYVINYDLPVNANDYIHRVGRTARTSTKNMATQASISDKNAKQALSKNVASTKHFGMYQAPAVIVKDIQGHVFSLVTPEQERLVPLITKAIGKDIKLEPMPW